MSDAESANALVTVEPKFLTIEDYVPWRAHELQEMLSDRLADARANLAKSVLDHSFLEFDAHEFDRLDQSVLIDIVIKVDGAHNPASKSKASFWLNGKGTEGDEIRQRMETPLRAMFAGLKRVRLRELRFLEISPRAIEDLARERAALHDADATNQANVHPASPAKIQSLGLRFRSYPELLVWKALLANLREGESASALPVVSSAPFDRFEPDFLLFTKQGHALLEIDGPTHQEDHATAAKRTSVLEDVGFHVFRVNVADVNTLSKAESWVRKILDEIRSGASRVTA